MIARAQLSLTYPALPLYTPTHTHTHRALNTFGYAGHRGWNMVVLCFWVFFRGSFVSPAAVLKTWGPFALLVAVVLILRYK